MNPSIKRRDFLKASAGVSGLFATNGLFKGLLGEAEQTMVDERPRWVKETPTICPFCGVGCGFICGTDSEGNLINYEGDSEHPINQGSACSKGVSNYRLQNEQRLSKVLYRAPGSSQWEEKSWDWAIDKIARNIKDTRDNNWIAKNGLGQMVNRTEALASVGSVFPTDQEGYLMTKMQRALGMVYIENQARICVSTAVAGNTETMGRGPMTNHWIDLKNSDCIMLVGGAAESFPIGFKWVRKAIENGCKVIHVDPRFSRTSAKADIHANIRIGTDVAFAGGVINYIINDMINKPNDYNMTYVKEYTNASFLVSEGFGFDDGIFSGYDPITKSYDKSSWSYQIDSSGTPKMDKDLGNPNCVFQLLKKHFSRYDVNTVCNTTGISEDTFLSACKAYAATGARDKAGAMVLSSGIGGHSHGTQSVRAYGIIQLLLGNIGIAGGGINGVSGASNGLGCSLQGRINHWLPGTLPPPNDSQQSIVQYTAGGGNAARMTSLLKAFWGNHATKDNDFAFNLMPKRGGDYSWVKLFNNMNEGIIKGLICWGMNPAVSSPDSNFTCEAMEKLDWMVAIDIFETETASFWKRPGISSKDNNVEVFLLPAAGSLEKEGSITNSARWMQWRCKAINPPGEAKEDLWITNKLMLKLRELYVTEGGPNSEAITELDWDYGEEPDANDIAKEINGYDLTTGKLIANLTKLKADGSTSCGNWIFSGSYNEDGNMSARRDPSDYEGLGLYPGWAWSWPLNRRIFYNRASVDLDGNPWDEKRPLLKWDEQESKWMGDNADGGAPPVNNGGSYPFIMKMPYNRGDLYGPGRVEGPFPEHYESWESPVNNPISSQQSNPSLKTVGDVKKGDKAEYPIIATTYRLVEHMGSGTMTRNNQSAQELMPEMHVEISEELASSKGISSGDMVKITSARGATEALAMVTKRLKPISAGGETVHQIALPWNWGYTGVSKGSTTNTHTAYVCDPNTMMPELRAFLVKVEPA